jgi:hypothetical protein
LVLHLHRVFLIDVVLHQFFYLLLVFLLQIQLIDSWILLEPNLQKILGISTFAYAHVLPPEASEYALVRDVPGEQNESLLVVLNKLAGYSWIPFLKRHGHILKEEVVLSLLLTRTLQFYQTVVLQGCYQTRLLQVPVLFGYLFAHKVFRLVGVEGGEGV